MAPVPPNLSRSALRPGHDRRDLVVLGQGPLEFLIEEVPGVMGATLVVMIMIFLLGFILDFIEITFVVVPIVGPILLAMENGERR